MSDFDPFGDNTGYYPKKGNKKKGNKNITVLLIILLLVIAGYYAYQKDFLFKKVEISFNVKNAENQSLNNASILLSKDYLMEKNVKTLKNSQIEKIRKGVYYYTVKENEYQSIPRKKIEIKQNTTQDIKLEKDVSLKINNINFPKSIYPGQKAVLEINYTNNSLTKKYSLDDIVIDGVKDWSLTILDVWGDPLENQEIFFEPAETATIKLEYVTKEISEKKGNISVRVKYKTEKKSFEFEILKKPEVNITGDVSGKINSGETKSFNLVVNNTKNKTEISDLIVEIDVNGKNNENVKEWFQEIYGNLYVFPSKNLPIALTINVPNTAKSDELVGKITFKSNAFEEPKQLPINLKIEELPINFVTKSDKTNITLKFDEDKNILSKEYANLKINSNVDVDIKKIEIINQDPTLTDCNHLILLPENPFGNNKVFKGIEISVLVTVTLIEGEQAQAYKNTNRACGIAIEYQHPYRAQETLLNTTNFFINVK